MNQTKVFDKLENQLIRMEGERLHVYDDGTGVPTIGIGRNIRDKGISDKEASDLGISENTLNDIMSLKISHSAAIYLLRNDIKEIESMLRQFSWYCNLSDVRKDAIINIVFNVGETEFLAWTRTILALESGNFERAAKIMLLKRNERDNCKWVFDVKTRALELSEQIRLGRYLTDIEIENLKPWYQKILMTKKFPL